MLMMVDTCIFFVCLGVLMFYLFKFFFVILKKRYTPLYWAAGGGRLSVVQLLLSAHANVNQATKVSKLKLSKLYYSLVEVLFILWFIDGDNDDDF